VTPQCGVLSHAFHHRPAALMLEQKTCAETRSSRHALSCAIGCRRWRQPADEGRVMTTVEGFADRALRESEERWGTLVAHIREMVILVDPDGLVTYTSPSVERWLGYEAEELVGRKITAVTAISHVDDAVALASALDRCEPARPVSLTHRLKAKDGSCRWLESTMVCLREDPLVGGY
jgi:PAS domain S-box-containing protein